MRNPGRPTKSPKVKNLRNIGILTPVAPDIVEILKTHHWPATWGNKQMAVIFTFFRTPFMIRKSPYAATFAAMFAEAPDLMMDCLPKIRTKIDRFFSTGKGSVVLYYGAICDAGRYTPNEVNERKVRGFWEDKAELVAERVKRITGINPSSKDVEHGRAEVRKFCNFPK